MPNPDRPPRLLPGSDAAAAYRLVRGRIDALLRGRPDVAERTVPACPDWTIRHTVAHLVGVAADVVALNLEGLATDAWTRAQVDRLAGNGIDELLDRWGRSIDPLTAMLVRDIPELSAGQLIFDVLAHEHDIRGALGEPDRRTGDLAFEVALGFLTTKFDQLLGAAGMPAVRLTTPMLGTVRLGSPDTTAQVALEIGDFEALRTFGGRRSVRQLLALPWQGDVTGLLPALNSYGGYAIHRPGDDLIE